MKLVCTMCPMGCEMEINNDGGNFTAAGNQCARGIDYAKNEFTDPKRIVTALITLTDGKVVSVKTTGGVPKNKVKDIVNEITKLKLNKAEYGKIIIKNVLNTGADVVVTGY